MFVKVIFLSNNLTNSNSSSWYLKIAWALKRGYFTAKASRPDVYRAANELLRMALDGKLCLSLKPINYTKQKEFWSQHPETKDLDDVVRNVEQTAIQNLNLNLRDDYKKSNDLDDLDEYDDDDENAVYFDKHLLTSEDKSEHTEEETPINQTTNFFSALLRESLNDE